jgi:hypothetical protein
MPSPLPQILPPLPPWLRLAILGALVAGMVYIVAAIEAAPPPEIGETLPSMETAVALPQLDEAELANARDVTREQRLKLEPDPLRHLLARAIDVGPTVAAALGVPGKPVPVETIRAAPDEWRGRWLWYEGELEDLAGPRQGHPIEGYSIYEATIRLPDGHHAIGAFSIPPAPELQRGSWVRIEGFLLKLRDTTYPLEVERAPMLVGRRLQRDYEDWGPVTELDKDLLAKVDDSDHFPGSLMWRRVDADQTEAVWHLAAFARDTADQRTRADWRRLPLLNATDHFEKFRDHEIARGTPIRVIGTLIYRQTLAAPPNPAGIEFWTEAGVQVREYGGAIIPIWVPKRVAELPRRAQLEVRGFYYRWAAYEMDNGDRRWVPLFIAADLDPYVLDTGPALREMSIGLVIVFTLLLIMIFWSQRQVARQRARHEREMDARRRRRRERVVL